MIGILFLFSPLSTFCLHYSVQYVPSFPSLLVCSKKLIWTVWTEICYWPQSEGVQSTHRLAQRAWVTTDTWVQQWERVGKSQQKNRKKEDIDVSLFKKKNLFAGSEMIFRPFLHFPLCLQNKTDETPPSSSNCCSTVLATDYFSVCCKNLPLYWPRDWCLMLDLKEDLKAGSCCLNFSKLLN